MTDDQLPDDLVKPAKAAQLLGVHVNTIYRWIDAGRLRTWRVGCHLRVSTADVKGMAKREERGPKELPSTRRQVARLDRWARDVLKQHGITY